MATLTPMVSGKKSGNSTTNPVPTMNSIESFLDKINSKDSDSKMSA